MQTYAQTYMDNVEISTVMNRFSKRYTKKSFLSNRECIDKSQKGSKLKETFPPFPIPMTNTMPEALLNMA